MTELNKIICGPILRRVDPSAINIWMVFSEEVGALKSVIYSLEEGKKTVLGESNQSTSRFGENLHMAFVTIVPTEGTTFPTDTILQYDIDMDGEWLSELPIIKELTYTPFDLPTFYIQSPDHPLNLLFGSCRKIHGPGYDALSCGDDVMATNANNIAKRPSVLFLGGDQIYADDISSVMMPIIMNLAESIVGTKEKLGLKPNEIGSGSTHSDSSEDYRFGSRGMLLKSEIDLTQLGYHADNHIIKFGEYAALYCLSWNPDLWPTDWKDKATKNLEDISLFTNEGEDKKDKDVKKRVERHKNEIELVSRFHSSLPKVRRLMANISCYMIFDDHEISDDWNISFDWCTRMIDNPLGVQMLSNGLSAYAVFQAWGNNPHNFPDKNIEKIRLFCEEVNKGQMNHENGQTYYEEMTLGFDNWDFISATYPQALFLDTRTQRYFEYFSDLEKEFISIKTLKEIIFSGTNKAINFLLKVTNKIASINDDAEEIARQTPAQLIKTGYFEWLKEKYRSYVKDQNLILVSATPVFGLQRFEDVVRYGGKLMEIHKWDNEAWAANYNGYLKLLQFLKTELQPKNCVILSGDVHYGFAVSNEVELDDIGSATKYIQITSSSLKNNAKDQLDRIRKILEEFEIYSDDEKVHEEIKWIENREYHQFDANESQQVRIVSNNNLGHLIWDKGEVAHRFLFYKEDEDQPIASNEVRWQLK